MSEALLLVATQVPDSEIPWTVPWRVITIFVIFFSGLLTLVGNTLTVIAIYKFRVLREVVSNLYLLSLSVSSLAMVPGLLLTPASVYGPHTLFAEQVWYVVSMLPVVSYLWVSCLTLLTISFDRLIAVQKPMQYKIIMSRRNVLVSIALTWTAVVGVLIPILLSFSLTAEPEMVTDMLSSTWGWMPRGYVLFQSVCGASLPVLISVMYAVILRTLVRSMKRRVHPSELNSIQSDKIIKKTKRRVKMMGILVVCVFTSYTPSGVYLFLNYNKDTEMIKMGYKLCVTFQMVSSTLNPVIYCWQNHNFRSAFATLLRMKKNSVTESGSSRGTHND